MAAPPTADDLVSLVDSPEGVDYAAAIETSPNWWSCHLSGIFVLVNYSPTKNTIRLQNQHGPPLTVPWDKEALKGGLGMQVHNWLKTCALNQKIFFVNRRPHLGL